MKNFIGKVILIAITFLFIACGGTESTNVVDPVSPDIVTTNELETQVTEAVTEAIASAADSDATEEPTDGIPPLIGPAPRIGAPIFYDPIAKHAVLIGGFSCDMAWRWEPMHFHDLWSYNAEEESWEELGDLDVRNPFTIGYDAESEHLIILTSGPVQTWSYHPASGEIENLEPEEMPQVNEYTFNFVGSQMAYDAESDRIILFGGADGPGREVADTWAYDYNSNTWENMEPANRPPGRAFHQMVYDSESDRVIMWGGGINLENDISIWAYDYNSNSWERLENINGPEIHYERFGMIYHPPSDRVIIYSGFVEGFEDREEQFNVPATWSYDFNTNQWEEISSLTNPGPRMWYSMTYDENSDQIILFGGEKTGKYEVDLTNAIWLFDFETMQWRDATVTYADCTE